MDFTIFAITWDVDPVFFTIGGFEIRYYSLLWALAFIQGMIVLSYMLKREGEPKKYNDALFWYVILGTIIGARLGHCLFYDPAHYLSNPIEILYLRDGGLASHGGTIGIMIGLFLFSRKYKKTYIWILDRGAMLGPLAAAFIRFGNLFNSEIYGVETDKPWGFIFVRNGETIAKHPTQLYEAIAYLMIFFILLFLYKKLDAARKYPGMMIGVMFVWIFTFRFFIETIKNNQEAFEATMTLNMGQWLSIPFVLLGIYLIVNSLKKKR